MSFDLIGKPLANPLDMRYGHMVLHVRSLNHRLFLLAFYHIVSWSEMVGIVTGGKAEFTVWNVNRLEAAAVTSIASAAPWGGNGRLDLRDEFEHVQKQRSWAQPLAATSNGGSWPAGGF